MRLHTRITILVAVSVLSTGLISSMLVSHSLHQLQERELARHARIVASILGEHVEHNVQDHETEEAREALIQAVSETRDLQYAFVTGAGGEVLAHSFPTVFPRNLAPGMSPDQTSDSYRTVVASAHLLDVSYPLTMGGGVLHVGFSEEYLDKREDWLWGTILLTTLIAAVIGIALGAYLSRRTTKPLAVLCDAMHAYGRGEDRDEADILAGDSEVTQLSQAFRAMKMERRVAEEDQRQAADFMQTVIDGFPETLMVINRDYTIALGNKPVREAAGGADFDQVCLKCHLISHHSETPCAGQGYPCPLDEVMETGHTVVAEHVHLAADGHEIHVELVAAPIFDEQGRVFQVIETCRDITDRRRAEEERHSLEKQMFKAQKLESLGLLAGGIAHDFNNIMMAVLGNTELAMMAVSPDAPCLQNLLAIEKATTRATALASQMLAYSGRGQFVIEPIDINAFVREMSSILKVSIGKNITLRMDLSAELKTIRGDETQVGQVVMNLITNASDAIGDHSGEIVVVTGHRHCSREFLDSCALAHPPQSHGSLAAGEYVFLEVRDTGCGMVADVRRKIFDPFFTTKDAGHGLGMAAVQGIMRGHHGVVMVESEPEQGTVFRLLFPVAEVQGMGDSRQSKGSLELPSVPANVGPGVDSGVALVVDDEETLRALGRRMLENLGFSVLLAANGQEAVEQFTLHAAEISCVLLDLTMPGMGGESAFRAIRDLDPGARIIVCSGYNPCGDFADLASDLKATFLRKPYSAAILAEKVRSVCLPS